MCQPSCHLHSRVLTVVAVIVLGNSIPHGAAAQDYQLVEPTGAVSANVYMQSDRMTVVDASGAKYRLERDRSFDSFDRQYRGFFLPSSNRVVRFPRSGQGLMQVADLDDNYPRYVNSRRTVRRARGGHHIHGPGHIFYPPLCVPPSYHPPFYGPSLGFAHPGYGYFNYGYFNYGPSLHVVRPIYRPSFQSMVLESKLIPRAPLPPVNVNLHNPAAREVIVTLADLQSPSQSKRIRIPPRRSAPVLIERDAGADRVQTVLTYAPDGSQITREITTPVPPATRYELTVHEWKLQSIAIDRTGKSPNPIEDTHFQGRGLGRFALPPGDQVTGGTIDVVRTALQSENAGSVAPILDESSSSPLSPVSPLEEMFLKQRAASGR